MGIDYKWANAIMDQLKGCQAENARLREEAAAMTTALQKVEQLEAEVASLRMALQCVELAGERRRVGGGSSTVEVKSSFISAKTLSAVLEALRSNWFFATDDDEDNNEDVIAATKMLEAEIADDRKRQPQPQPTLTDEEMDAVEHGLERLELHADTESRESAGVLRNLLSRLGGRKVSNWLDERRKDDERHTERNRKADDYDRLIAEVQRLRLTDDEHRVLREVVAWGELADQKDQGIVADLLLRHSG